MNAEPRATYRLQLEPRFRFEDAARIAGYLGRLGISHAYLSPCFESAPGSTHGYDVVDPSRVRRELGGEEAFEALLAAFEAHGIGVLLDIVPNHQAAHGVENERWRDVLERGAASRYASHFDVDWQSPASGRAGVLLLPVLGTAYGQALEAGELVLRREGASFWIDYGDHAFPVAFASLGGLLAHAANTARSESLALIAEVAAKHSSDASSAPWSGASHTPSEPELSVALARALLERELDERADLADAIDRAVLELNGDRNSLHRILEQQAYRLAYWRLVRRAISYRRFFDVTGLVGLRVEDERVFAATHARVTEWLERGRIAGVRIDHVDGLRDPGAYLTRLRSHAPDAWIVIEKILSADERVPSDWPIDGTTGYEFARLAGGLFVDPDGERPLTELWTSISGDAREWHDVMVASKRLVAHAVLGADLERLTTLLAAVCRRSWFHRDQARADLTDVLVEIAAAFPVYRSYVAIGSASARPTSSNGTSFSRTAQDEAWIAHATALAIRARPDLDPSLIHFVGATLCGLGPVHGEDATEFVLRFQQFTGPLAAKGAEDTALYRYLRLVARNEVGGSPGSFGTAVREFHAVCRENARTRPHSLLATSTHDTKRSEDVRARIALLSEIPGRWRAAVHTWIASNARHWRAPGPDPCAEYLLYQTLVGAWPISLERVVAYMEKAAREAKACTSWTEPDGAYETALRQFVTGVMSDPRFVRELEEFVRPLVGPGRVSSLALTLLKLTAPGVPDFYQGCELWDLHLVDPDNREPVDFALRARLIEELEGASAEGVLERADEGLPKLWLIRQALAFRAADPDTFGASGGYRGLDAEGARAPHVVAFLRGDRAITVVPRWTLRLGNDWHGAVLRLPEGTWRNVLTGDGPLEGSVTVESLLKRFPVALLARKDRPAERS